MSRLSITDLTLKGKKVLIRVDYNVPFDQNGEIADDSRIIASLPTIKYVLDQGGTPILMSHLGRPKGKVLSKLSLAPCAKRLAIVLAKPVVMAPDCIGDEVKRLIKNLKDGESILLQNLRFHPEEENPSKNDSFAKELANLGDVYIDDAFGAAHRAHSSITSIAKYFPDQKAAGFLLEKEITYLGKVFLNPKRPFFAIVGGAKISSKLGVIKSLIQKVDTLFIGGAMAYTFLKALNVNIGSSQYEPELVDKAKGIIDSFKIAGVNLKLPKDHVIVNTLSNDAKTSIVTNKQGIPKGYFGVDIGPLTIQSFSEDITKAATLFWNGPVGIFELPNFAKGTRMIANTIAKTKGIKVVGGGDSVAAIRSMNLSHRFDHLSTGGGASLEFIEFGTLPGIEALENE